MAFYNQRVVMMQPDAASDLFVSVSLYFKRASFKLNERRDEWCVQGLHVGFAIVRGPTVSDFVVI